MDALQALHLTEQQKISLRGLWAVSSSAVAHLIKHHHQLSVRLMQLLQQQREKHRQFDLACRQVMVEDTEQESLFGPWFAKHKQGARAQAVTGRTLQSMSHADSNTMHAYLLQHILGGHIGSLQIGCKQSASNNNRNSKKIDDCTGAFQLLTVHPELAFECWSSEQQELEERMSDVMGKISVLLFMHEMQMINLLSKKQLALAAVHSYPYCFSAFSGEYYRTALLVTKPDMGRTLHGDGLLHALSLQQALHCPLP